MQNLFILNLPWGYVIWLKMLGSIGSAVFTFIGYKQTNKSWESRLKIK